MGKNTGFSLIELMVVIAIFAILSTIAVPSMLSWRTNYKLDSAAREILSALEYGRSRAVRDDQVVQVNFDFANNSYSVVNQGGATLRAGQMTADLDLQNISLGSQVQFIGRGVPDVSGAITIGYVADPSLVRRVNLSIGGNARMFTP